MTRLKKFILTYAPVFLTVILLFTIAQGAVGKVQDPYRVDTFDIETPGSLQVLTSGGYIIVEGESDNSVRVEMYVQKDGEYLSPDEEELKDWNINISQTGNSVKAQAERKGNSWNLFNSKNSISVSFVVYAPREVDSDLKTSGGHITTKSLSGDQEISTSGGHIKLNNMQGKVNARTSGGHITAENLDGEMNVKTSGGHIDMRNAQGRLDIKTSGGHIDLAKISGTIEATTSGGSISADLLSIDEFATLKTSGGNVSINVPGNTGFDLDLRGSFVRSDLVEFSGKTDRDEIHGQVFGGGPSISAKTSGGMVSLSFD